jgi:hypothetical protein
MVISNYSKPDDWEKMNALSQYGQMTAGTLVRKELYTEQHPWFSCTKRSPEAELLPEEECLAHNQKQEILQLHHGLC